jgi:hypothetical protein
VVGHPTRRIMQGPALLHVGSEGKVGYLRGIG